MEVARTFLSHPSDLEILDLLRRRVREGEIASWIHEASVYDADPMATTARYEAATAADGTNCWYFLLTPEKKDNHRDAWIRRTAGPGTWKGERKRPVYGIGDGGVRRQIGWRRTLSFIIKDKAAHKDERIGWITVEFQLADGTDTALSLYKLYRSPRIEKTRLARSPPASPTSAASAAAASSHTSSPPPAAAAAAASSHTSSPPPAAAAAAASPMGSSGGITTQILSNSSGSTAARSPEATPSDSPQATMPSSPPKRWLHVQVSNSPTKSSDLSSAKRVYRMLVPEEEGSPPLSAKKLKSVDCRGWLTIEPLRAAENPVA